MSGEALGSNTAVAAGHVTDTHAAGRRQSERRSRSSDRQRCRVAFELELEAQLRAQAARRPCAHFLPCWRLLELDSVQNCRGDRPFKDFSNRHRLEKMSWQTYVDTSLIGTKCVTKAAIHGHKGEAWGTSNGFKVRVDMKFALLAVGSALL